MKKIIALIAMLTIVGCNGQENKNSDIIDKKTKSSEDIKNSKFEVSKTDEQWKNELTSLEYDVLRNKATERPHTGEYNKHFEKGVYVCAGCKNPLFTSDAKFNSSCGWPSFDQAINGSVIYEEDKSFGMNRTEVMCAKCGGHLGHVFDDGPKETTGNRFCTNSVSIKFLPAKQ